MYDRLGYAAYTRNGSNFIFPDPDNLKIFFMGRYTYLLNDEHNFFIGLRSNGNAFYVDIPYYDSVRVYLSDKIEFDALDLMNEKRLVDRLLATGVDDNVFKKKDVRYPGFDEDEMSVNDYNVSYTSATINDIKLGDCEKFNLEYQLNYESHKKHYQKRYPFLSRDALLYLMFIDKYFGHYLGYYRGKLNATLRPRKDANADNT